MEGVVFKKNKFISWDYGTGESVTCVIYGKYNKKGEMIIEKVEYLNDKEVKKMSRPYFETKVVKVKKGEKCEHVGRAYPYSKTGDTVECVDCGKKFILGQEEPKPKGNWVNGENLDKMKFPCFCSWNIPLDNEKQYGLLIKGYSLYSLRKQSLYQDNLVEENKNLEPLIKRWDIHILKGKIIIYEEE